MNKIKLCSEKYSPYFIERFNTLPYQKQEEYYSYIKKAISDDNITTPKDNIYDLYFYKYIFLPEYAILDFIDVAFNESMFRYQILSDKILNHLNINYVLELITMNPFISINFALDNYLRPIEILNKELNISIKQIEKMNYAECIYLAIAFDKKEISEDLEKILKHDYLIRIDKYDKIYNNNSKSLSNIITDKFVIKNNIYYSIKEHSFNNI